MKIRLYKFSKRDNSTKQPGSSDSYVEKNVALKDDTDIHTPSFELHTTDATYTYVYIPDWNKYYFVSDVTYINNSEVIYNLEEDSLATKKTDIGNTVAHIAYSSTGWDKWLIDSRLPAKTTKTIKSASADPAGVFSSSGCYILTVVSDGSATGITAQFALSTSSFRTLANKLFTDQNIQDAIKKYLNSPFDAVVGCIWVPFELSEIPGTSGTIEFGGESTGVQGTMLTSTPVRASVASVSIPWQYSDFRRSSPYTSISIWLPGYGYTDLNASDLVNETSIKVDFMCDCGTGNILYRIFNSDSSKLYASGSYDASINVPISSVSVDTGGVISGIGGMASGGVMAGVTGAIGDAVGAISSATGVLTSGTNAILSANKRTVSTRGSYSGRAIFGAGIAVKVYTFSVDTADPDATEYIAKWGRPVGVTHAINNHSGYVQCDNASIAMDGDSYERATINGYLNSGFYYE